LLKININYRQRRFTSSRITILAGVILYLFLVSPAQRAIASSSSPTLFVNTEAFQVLDEGDGSTNVELRFGDTIDERMRWDISNARFQFTDDLHVEGNITGSGTLTIDGAVTFGSTIRLSDVTYTFPTSDGTATGKVLKTDGAGNLVWSDDSTGGGGISQTEGDERYVNVSGDTMTGGLLINPGGDGTGVAEVPLEVNGTMSGRALSITTDIPSETGAIFVDMRANSTGMLLNSIANNAPGIAIDIVGISQAPHLSFGYEGSFDTNLYRAGPDSLQTDDSMSVLGGLSVTGAILTESNITINLDNAGQNAVLTFGNDAAAETLLFSDTNNVFEFSDGVDITSTNDASALVVTQDYASASDNYGVNVEVTTSNTNNNTAGKFRSDTGAGGGNQTAIIAISGDDNTSFFEDAAIIASVSDSATNVIPALSLGRTREGGNGAAGIGTSIRFFAEKSSNQADLVGELGALYEDATNGAVKGALTFGTTTGVSATLSENMRLTSSGFLGIGTTLPEVALEAVGTLSGADLVVSNLRNCDTIDTDGAGALSCGTDDGGGGGISQTEGDERYVNVSGDTMTGGLTIQHSNGLASSGNIITEGNLTINSDNAAQNAVLTFGNDATAETLIFSDTNEHFEFSDDIHAKGNITGSGGLTVNTASIFKDSLEVKGVLSGSTLNIMGSSASHFLGKVGIGNIDPDVYSLYVQLVPNATKAAYIEGNTDIVGDVKVVGSLSGTSLVVGESATFNGVSYTFPAFDGSATGKVLKTDSAGNLSWSEDTDTNTQNTYEAGEGLSLNGSVFTLLEAITGATLDTTGNITTDANLTINEDNGATDAVLTFGNSALPETLTFSFSANRFEFSDDVYTTDTLTVDGATTLSSTVSLNGVTYTFPYSDGTATGKVLKTDGAGNLVWSDDDTGGGGGISYAEAASWFVNKGGDTMTGALNVQATVSGTILHARDHLRSSGTLLIAGTSTLQAATATTVDTTGNITTDANLTINEDNGATDAVLTFGNDAAAETLLFSDTTNGFIFSDDVEVQGALSGATVFGYDLNNSKAATSGSILVSRTATEPEWKDPDSAMVWFIDDTLTAGTSKGSIVIMPFGMTLTNVNLKVHTPPTGAAIIVDINEDGSTLFTTRPQINTTATDDNDGHSFTDTVLAEGAVLDIDIDQVGSTYAGSGLTIMLYGTIKY
jgi:hypothetical protein